MTTVVRQYMDTIESNGEWMSEEKYINYLRREWKKCREFGATSYMAAIEREAARVKREGK